MIEDNSNNNKVAFKDFKNAISNEEFLSILAMAKEEYSKLEKIIKSRKKFAETAKMGINVVNSNSGNMPPGLAEKLIKGLERKANGDINKMFSEEIARHKSVVDFINRFQDTEEQYIYLNFSFLKIK